VSEPGLGEQDWAQATCKAASDRPWRLQWGSPGHGDARGSQGSLLRAIRDCAPKAPVMAESAFVPRKVKGEKTREDRLQV